MPLSKRIPLIFIASILCLACILDILESSFSISLILLSLTSVLTSLFNERWTINFQNQVITYSFGFLFLSKHSHWPLNELKKIRAISFTKGFRKTPFIRLVIEFSNEIKIIEIASEKKITPLLLEAQKISDFYSFEKEEQSSRGDA